MRTPKGNLPRVFDEHLSQETLQTVLGFELVEHGDGLVKGRVAVTDRVKQEFGLVHGGVYAALAEGLCSLGTFYAVQDQGMLAMGQQNNTSFLRPVTEG